jgi:hypothetical protein
MKTLYNLSQISDEFNKAKINRFHYLPKEIVEKILFYIKHISIREVDQQFKNIYDQHELSCADIPLQLDFFLQKKYIRDYISTQPETIAYSFGDKCYIYRVIATDNGKYVYDKYLDGHANTGFSISYGEVGMCEKICEHANDSKFFPGPRFIYFILTHRLLGDNVDFVKKKLVATVRHFLKNYDINRNKYGTVCFYEDILSNLRIDNDEYVNDSSVVDDILTNLTKISPPTLTLNNGLSIYVDIGFLYVGVLVCVLFIYFVHLLN